MQRILKAFSCFDIIRPGRDQEDEVLCKLEIQTKVHMAKIEQLEQKLREVEFAKKQHVLEKDIPAAKRKIIEKHKLTKQIVRFVQLRDACENMKESITDSSMVKETFSVLSDVSWTFKNIKFDDKFSAQLEKFSDDLDDFKIDFTEINEALTNMNTDQTYDEDLENELNELLVEDSLEKPVIQKLSPVFDIPQRASPLNPPQRASPLNPPERASPLNPPERANPLKPPNKETFVDFSQKVPQELPNKPNKQLIVEL